MFLKGYNVVYWYATTGGTVYPASDEHYTELGAMLDALWSIYETYRISDIPLINDEDGSTKLYRQSVTVSGNIEGYLYTAIDFTDILSNQQAQTAAVSDETWITSLKVGF